MQSLYIPIGEVTASGLGLAFVTFPVGVSMMPTGASVIGVLLFLTLFFLGIDSAFFLAHGGVISPIKDKFGTSGKKATLIVCILGFLVGILFTTRGGLYWLDIVDRATAFYGLVITGAVASLVVGWKFKANNLREHLNETSDIKVGPWWNWLLKIIVPAGLLFMFIYGGFVKDLASPYEGYPLWAASMIWVILFVTLVLSFVFQRFKTKTPDAEGKEE
jgi:NSS family neurotransmitter:Na+ symporter